MEISKAEKAKLACMVDPGPVELGTNVAVINSMFGTNFEQPEEGDFNAWYQLGLKVNAVIRVNMVEEILKEIDNV